MRRVRGWGWVAAGILLAGGTAVLGGEGPSFQVDVLDTKVIYTATPADSAVPGFKPHINFPWLTRRGDGSLLVWFTIGQTHGVGLFGLASTSNDNGQTWSTPSSSWPSTPYVLQVRPPGQVSRGFIISYYPDPPTPFTTFTGARGTSTDGGLNWTWTTAYFDCGTDQYLSMYNNPGDVLSIGPTLMITAFAQRPGVSTFENVLFVSTDSGVHWTRRATPMSYVAGPSTSMGEEGPNESDVLRLTNGNLLSVSRTGQPFPNDLLPGSELRLRIADAQQRAGVPFGDLAFLQAHLNLVREVQQPECIGYAWAALAYPERYVVL